MLRRTPLSLWIWERGGHKASLEEPARCMKQRTVCAVWRSWCWPSVITYTPPQPLPSQCKKLLPPHPTKEPLLPLLWNTGKPRQEKTQMYWTSPIPVYLPGEWFPSGSSIYCNTTVTRGGKILKYDHGLSCMVSQNFELKISFSNPSPTKRRTTQKWRQLTPPKCMVQFRKTDTPDLQSGVPSQIIRGSSGCNNMCDAKASDGCNLLINKERKSYGLIKPHPLSCCIQQSDESPQGEHSP